MSGMWKRSHGRTSEPPPDERGGYRYVRPTATAQHLDSTLTGRQSHDRRTRKIAPNASFETTPLSGRWWGGFQSFPVCPPTVTLPGGDEVGFDRIEITRSSSYASSIRCTSSTVFLAPSLRMILAR